MLGLTHPRDVVPTESHVIIQEMVTSTIGPLAKIFLETLLSKMLNLQYACNKLRKTSGLVFKVKLPSYLLSSCYCDGPLQ